MHRPLFPLTLFLLTVSLTSSLPGQQPSVQQALSLQPMQRDVEYDRPTGKQVKDCLIEPEEGAGTTAWVVRGPGGKLLRRFSDTNGDNKVDQWCYFADGIEVYRDIDADYNTKADQYRWLTTTLGARPGRRRPHRQLEDDLGRGGLGRGGAGSGQVRCPRAAGLAADRG
jgi:hypothetical protein